MESKFLRYESTGVLKPISTDNSILDEFPMGVYVIRFIPMQGYQFEPKGDFTFPEKIYGDSQQKVDRVLSYYGANNSNLGVMLLGLKGTGKSLTAKMIAQQSGLPVIVIDQNYANDPNFFSFISNISRRVVFFFDEFEKVFDKDHEGQDKLLSWLDGTYSSENLFVLTGNDKYRINQYFKDRPGRIRYYYEYEGLDEEIVEEIVDDLLENEAHKADIMMIFDTINNNDLTYDKVISFIKEVNFFDGQMSPKQLFEGFNIGIGGEGTKGYDMIYSIGDLSYKGSAYANFIDFKGELERVSFENAPRLLTEKLEYGARLTEVDIDAIKFARAIWEEKDEKRVNELISEFNKRFPAIYYGHTLEQENVHRYLGAIDMKLDSLEVDFGKKGRVILTDEEQNVSITFTPRKERSLRLTF